MRVSRLMHFSILTYFSKLTYLAACAAENDESSRV